MLTFRQASRSLARSAAAASYRRVVERRFDVNVFCAQLSVLVNAGLGVVEGLRALQANSVDPAVRAVLDPLVSALRTGQSLSTALAAQPQAFPPLFVAMVRSAERTSNLVPTLQRYLTYARQIDEVRAKVRAAAIYPVFLTGAGVLVIAFLAFYVVPRFAGVYESVHVQLPWAALLMLRWGQAVSSHSWMVTGGAGVLIGTAIVLWRSRGLRLVLMQRLGTLPYVGEVLHKLHLARLYRTLAMLLSGGIPLYQSMQMARQLLPTHLASRLDAATQQVARGSSASQALQRAGLTTAISMNLVLVGERSGRLYELFDESARFLELETGRAIEQTMRVLEPALMAAIGIAIGVIVILMYLPIFELAGSMP